MSEGFSQWAERFDALTVRERLLILVTALVAILLPVFVYVLEPAHKQQRSLSTQVAQLTAANAEKQLDIQTLATTQRPHPDVALQTRIEQLRQQLERLNQSLQAGSAALVSPREMLTMLEQVLSRQEGLKLLSVSKAESTWLPPEPPEPAATASDAPTTAADAPGGIYRHDLKLVVEGGFFEVLSYLQALEQLHQGFFWDSIDYRVVNDPTAEVSIEIHTLSTEKGWLGV